MNTEIFTSEAELFTMFLENQLNITYDEYKSSNQRIKAQIIRSYAKYKKAI